MSIRSIKSNLKRHYLFVQTINLTQNLFTKHLSNKSIAKSSYLLAIILGAVIFTSCQKEELDSSAINSTTSGSSSEARRKFPFQFGNGNSPDINYGALIGAPTSVGSLDFQLNVADQLGISCIRARTLVPATGLSPILNTGYDVLLNFNTADYFGEPMIYPTDMAQYRQDLEGILSTYTIMPVVAVIENEECNKIYTTSSPEDYLEVLNTAIDVMHSHGIKVANGGLTYIGLDYLVWKDYMDRGMESQAEDFRQRTGILPNAQFTQERGAIYEKLLDAYTKNDLDYINFHWKGASPDAQALGEVIDYLKRTTGKPVITNELGQIDKDPNTLTTHVQKCTDKGLPYILWYSPDENENRNAVSLQYTNAELTPSGVEYQDYLSKK